MRLTATRIATVMAARSLLVFFSFSATPVFPQTTLQTYTGKAAFLAATAAIGARGPLPNLGCVTGGAGLTAGSLTFRADPGGGDVCSGAAGTGAAPDWYPHRATTSPRGSRASNTNRPSRLFAWL